MTTRRILNAADSARYEALAAMIEAQLAEEAETATDLRDAVEREDDARADDLTGQYRWSVWDLIREEEEPSDEELRGEYLIDRYIASQQERDFFVEFPSRRAEWR